MLHMIPDDGAPHSPSSECGCGPAVAVVIHRGESRRAYVHHDQTAGDVRQEGPNYAASRRP